mgnify:CR=1 FL=1
MRRQLEVYVRRFLQSLGTIEAAENRLTERIQAAIAAEIAAGHDAVGGVDGTAGKAEAALQ